MGEVLALPVDGTSVKDQSPCGSPSALNTVSDDIKKPEVAEGELKLMVTDNTTTEAPQEEELSQPAVSVPAATAPDESTDSNRRRPRGGGSGALKKARN